MSGNCQQAKRLNQHMIRLLVQWSIFYRKMGPIKFTRVVSCSSEDPVSILLQLINFEQKFTSGAHVHFVDVGARINLPRIWLKTALTGNGGANLMESSAFGLNLSWKKAVHLMVSTLVTMGRPLLRSWQGELASQNLSTRYYIVLIIGLPV
jgi:hypothetical protein